MKVRISPKGKIAAAVAGVGENIPVTFSSAGMLLHVRITPKSAAPGVRGVESRGGKPYLKVHVTAAPEDGKANAALVAVVAAWLGVPKSAVAIASGQKARIKTLRIAGEEQLFREIVQLINTFGGDLLANSEQR